MNKKKRFILVFVLYMQYTVQSESHWYTHLENYVLYILNLLSIRR